MTLGPDYDYYTAAETLNMTELEIPATINGYDVGEIFLVDLYWIRDITILGTSSDIYLIGDFQALETITIDGPEYTSLTDHRTAIINGSFDSLIGVDIKNTNRYNLYLSYYEFAENPDYFTIVDSLTPHYDFPLLETVTITDSFLNYVKIGDDNLGYAFPSLDTVSVSGSITGNFTLGEESNQFDKLSTVSFSNSNVSSVTISGSKDALETPTALAIEDTTVSYDVSISGSVIGSIAFLDSTIGNLHIDDGEVNPSVFQTLTFDNTLFDEDMGNLQINGSHPELENLNLENVNPTTIKIGSVESVFANLTSINVESVDAWSLRIGDRDASFPMLQSLVMNITDFEWSVIIGAENVTFPALETISIEKTNAESFEIGYSVTDLSGIVLINCLDVVLNTSLSIRNSSEESSEATIVLTDVDSPAINISGSSWAYDLYFDDIDATNLSISTPGCEKIYLNLADVTTWEFYDYANGLSIPMETGVYSPIE